MTAAVTTNSEDFEFSSIVFYPARLLITNAVENACQKGIEFKVNLDGVGANLTSLVCGPKPRPSHLSMMTASTAEPCSNYTAAVLAVQLTNDALSKSGPDSQNVSTSRFAL